jgi:hypothetical protein
VHNVYSAQLLEREISSIALRQVRLVRDALVCLGILEPVALVINNMILGHNDKLDKLLHVPKSDGVTVILTIVCTNMIRQSHSGWLSH